MKNLQMILDLTNEGPELSFDDGPVTPLVYRGCRGKNTPADLVERWKQGYPLDDQEKTILTSIIWSTPGY